MLQQAAFQLAPLLGTGLRVSSVTLAKIVSPSSGRTIAAAASISVRIIAPSLSAALKRQTSALFPSVITAPALTVSTYRYLSDKANGNGDGDKGDKGDEKSKPSLINTLLGNLSGKKSKEPKDGGKAAEQKGESEGGTVRSAKEAKDAGDVSLGALVPSSPENRLRKVLVVELGRKPLFPGIYAPVLVQKNEKLVKEILEAKKAGGQAYVGAFLARPDAKEGTASATETTGVQ